MSSVSRQLPIDLRLSMSEKDELAEIEEQGGVIKRLEKELEQAKESYHEAIRRLHVGGNSLREIAQRLNISHQRVHQIIESENKGWRQWLRPAAPELKCSFCGLWAEHVEKLVQGPNIFACNRCIKTCEKALSTKDAIRSTGLEFKRLEADSKLRCSFCSKLPRYNRPVVAGDEHQICNKCIGLSLQYMQEQPVNSAKATPTTPLKPALNKMTVILSLRIQRNSKWVRGMKRTIEDIKLIILPHYLPKELGDGEYELEVEYKDDADLDEKMNSLLTECHRMADMRNCFSESSIKQKGEDRWWD